MYVFFFALSLHIPRKDGFAQYSAFKSQHPDFLTYVTYHIYIYTYYTYTHPT